MRHEVVTERVRTVAGALHGREVVHGGGPAHGGRGAPVPGHESREWADHHLVRRLLRHGPVRRDPPATGPWEPSTSASTPEPPRE